jgi:thioredoxin-like negative regulator of GroEL
LFDRRRSLVGWQRRKFTASAQELVGRALVLKVDIEANPDLAARYRVQGVPTFIVFRNGEIVFQRAGVASRTEIRGWLSVERAPAA